MRGDAPLPGVRAVVTGASRGIGEAIARRLAADGAHVALVARSADDLQRVASAIAEDGGRADAVACDVTDREASREALGAWTAIHGPPTVLVNNAGGNVRASAMDYDDATWDALLALALTAPWHWSRLVHDGMREAGWGRIVNVSSVAGVVALPTGAPYAAAKAGLIQLTRSLAREWGPEGITVNAVAPWYVLTPLTEGVLGDEGYREQVLHETPAGRLGTPDDVAAAVAWLAGPEASWINGACLPVDGGFLASGFHPPTR